MYSAHCLLIFRSGTHLVHFLLMLRDLVLVCVGIGMWFADVHVAGLGMVKRRCWLDIGVWGSV